MASKKQNTAPSVPASEKIINPKPNQWLPIEDRSDEDCTYLTLAMQVGRDVIVKSVVEWADPTGNEGMKLTDKNVWTKNNAVQVVARKRTETMVVLSGHKIVKNTAGGWSIV